jgi:hypothetical protein
MYRPDKIFQLPKGIVPYDWDRSTPCLANAVVGRFESAERTLRSESVRPSA